MHVGALVGRARSHGPRGVRPSTWRVIVGLLWMGSSLAALHASPAEAAGIAQVQKGTFVRTTGTTSLTVTLPSASSAGNLLVVQAALNNTGESFTGGSGWQMAVGVGQAGDGRVEIWYRPNNPGGITTATFTLSTATTVFGLMSEWSGAALASVVDQTGTMIAPGSASSGTVSTGGATIANGELAITDWTQSGGSGFAYTPGAGWTHVVDQPSFAMVGDYAIVQPPGGVSETETYGTTVSQSVAVIATFVPPATTATVSVNGVGASGGTGSSGTAGLILTFPAGVAFGPDTLTGADQTVTAAVPIDMTDASGNGAGWALTITSTSFGTGGASPLYLATTVTAATPFGAPSTPWACHAGSTCALPAAPGVGAVVYPVVVPQPAIPGGAAPAPVRFDQAAAATGMGEQGTSQQFAMSIPANSYAGSYAATWTVSLISGP